MPSYNVLRALEAVVRLGTVGAAARELHVAQSAISHLLRHLENTLDMQLLQRKGRKVQPTPNGERLAAGLQDGFARVHAAVASVAHPVRGQRLTVACLPSVAARWMVPRLSDFRLAHPDIQLHIHYTNESATINVNLNLHAQIVQRVSGQRSERTTIPLHYRWYEFGHHDRRVRREKIERGT